MTMTSPRLTGPQKRLVESHVPLAQRVANEVWRRNRAAMDRSEVLAIAYQGLITAALKFDPEWRPDDDDYDPDLAFGSYARRWISGAILEWQRQVDHVPKRQRSVYKDLLRHGHGTGKSPEELAAITGLDPNKIRAVIHAVETLALSLDAAGDDWRDSPDSENTSSHLTSEEPSPFVSTAQEAFADALQQMPELQQQIFVYRYYSGEDLGKIAIILGVSSTVVRALHRDALDNIYDLLRRAVA